MTILGDFELHGEIGRGGMGTVYEAWQRSLKRTVAVKVLSPQVSSSPTAIARFQLEARAAAKLHHPHIVPIFALGEEDGVFYYAMELIEGRGLNAIIAESGARQAADTATADLAETVALHEGSEGSGQEVDPADGVADSGSPGVSTRAAGFSPRGDTGGATPALPEVFSSDEYFATVAQHISTTADALDYAHQQGVVHRDIKPHNLILGNDGKLCLSDFGLARLAEQPGVTVTGELLGSPLYMSPEQISGDSSKVDHRTDIYSLGVTMYEWLTLKPPYPGETREQVIGKILTSEPLSPTVHNTKIPVDLETICLKAIERDRERRYQTAVELRDDLRRFVANQPIKARRAGPALRIGKFVRRHQLASLASAAAVVAVTLGLTVISTRQEAKTAKAETEKLIDLLSILPLEIGGPLRAAGAAVPMLEGVVQGVQRKSGQGGNPQAVGPNPATVREPARIARGALWDFYETVGKQATPTSDPQPSDDVSTHMNQGKELSRTNPEAALTIIDAALAIRPDHFEARRLRAALRGRLGQDEKMLEDTEELVRLQQAAPGPLVWRALAHLLLKDSVSSLGDIDRGLELDPTGHRDFPWIHAVRGLALVQADRLIEANGAFDDALEGDPDFVVALLGRASGRAALGNLIGAVDDLTQVLERKPDDVDLLTCRGDHYLELNDFAAAESDYERAMNIAGRSPSMVMRYLSALTQRRSMNKSNTPGPSDSRSDADTKTGHVEPTDGFPSGSLRGWFSRRISPHPQEQGLSSTASRRAIWKSPRGMRRAQSLARTVVLRMSR